MRLSQTAVGIVSLIKDPIAPLTKGFRALSICGKRGGEALILVSGRIANQAVSVSTQENFLAAQVKITAHLLEMRQKEVED